MNKLSFSLFTRLYLTTLFVIFGVVVLVMYFDEIIYEQGHFNEFVEDTEFIFEQIEHNAQSETNPEQKHIVLSFPYNRQIAQSEINSEQKHIETTFPF